MSRIGKNPVPIPAGVDVELAGEMLNVSGGKGKLGRLSDRVSNEVSATRRRRCGHDRAEGRSRSARGRCGARRAPWSTIW